MKLREWLISLLESEPDPDPDPESEAKPVKRACINCKFLRTGHRGLKKEFGECHKGSPSPGYGECSLDRWRVLWPAVKLLEDCGDHKFIGEE